ncbi:hypothetical protein ACIPWI_33480 [Streptomyces sp. NPDC090046]|uniref:hypothetical protein n=1 Tax=Streptomyces sp. NPDC090046 TaxID=3365928 RepID=UPI00382A802F
MFLGPHASPLLPGCLGAPTLRLADAEALRIPLAWNDAPRRLAGASTWTPARCEAYANDQQQTTSLVAVSARSNRQKSDQDPFEWLPPESEALRRYASEWTATKLRWQLAVDQNEQDRLYDIAAGCGGNTVTYTPAP